MNFMGQEGMLKESIDSNLLIQLNQEKLIISLDYQKFNSQCHEIDMALAKYSYFLRVLELKSKFRHLALKNPKNKILLDNYLVVQSNNITF